MVCLAANNFKKLGILDDVKDILEYNKDTELSLTNHVKGKNTVRD